MTCAQLETMWNLITLAFPVKRMLYCITIYVYEGCRREQKSSTISCYNLLCENICTWTDNVPDFFCKKKKYVVFPQICKFGSAPTTVDQNQYAVQEVMSLDRDAVEEV